MVRISNRLWLISDTHFGHRAIEKFCGRPPTHEVIMLSNWIDRVQEDDQILHLGDVIMRKNGGMSRRWLKVISRLPGTKFLIKGNHDYADNSLYEDLAGMKVIEPLIYAGVAFTHRPISEEWPGPEGEWHTNIHGHIHNNGYAIHHDGHLLPDKHYINISVEVTDMAPVPLGNVAPISS